MTIILRRRRLGHTSCNAIAHYMNEMNEGTGREPVIVCRNDSPIPEGHNRLIRWGTTSLSGYSSDKILNQSDAIHFLNDKKRSRLFWQSKGVSVPRTVGEFETFLMDPFFPAIVRPSVHAQGRNLYYCTTVEEVRAACARHPDHYISQYIPKVAEYRVFMVDFKVVCVAKKTPADETAIAWNVARGGRFDNVRWSQWPGAVLKEAYGAYVWTNTVVSYLNFTGIDVMVDSEGVAYVLEGNSAPSLTSPYRQQCFAKALNFSMYYDDDDLIRYEGETEWKKHIHPALWALEDGEEERMAA